MSILFSNCSETLSEKAGCPSTMVLGVHSVPFILASNIACTSSPKSVNCFHNFSTAVLHC